MDFCYGFKINCSLDFKNGVPRSLNQSNVRNTYWQRHSGPPVPQIICLSKSSNRSRFPTSFSLQSSRKIRS
jgi:hypothetical protein